jgi:hypothetical protein
MPRVYGWIQPGSTRKSDIGKATKLRKPSLTVLAFGVAFVFSEMSPNGDPQRRRTVQRMDGTRAIGRSRVLRLTEARSVRARQGKNFVLNPK